DAKDLKPGLNLFAAGGDVSGAYVSGDRVVYFDTRRGAPTSYPLDPDAPPYELHVRILDQSGRPLYVRPGRAGFIDHSWAHELRADLSRPQLDPLERAASLSLLQEAMDSLAKVSLNARLTPEHQALVRSGTVIPDEMIHLPQPPAGAVAAGPPYNY